MTADALHHLKGLKRFSSLSERDLSLLAGMCTVRTYAAGETVLERTKSSVTFLILVQGMVTAIQRIGVAGSVKHFELAPPNFIGPTRFAANTDDYFDYLAQQDTTVLEVSRQDFQSMMRTNAPISRAMVLQLYIELAHQAAHLDEFVLDLYRAPGQTKQRLEDLTRTS